MQQPLNNHILRICLIAAITVFSLMLALPILTLAQTEDAGLHPAQLNASSGVIGFIKMKAWSPYAAGVGIGILSWFAFLFSNHPLGVSTAFAKTSGMLEKSLRGDQVLTRDYYQRFVPSIDWEWMLVVGLFCGALLSALLAGDFALSFLPPLWTERFGTGIWWRWLLAFGGGILIGIGARWANGCTSGHALSGTMQLAVSSWVTACGIFSAGIITALLIF
ncbi:MAG: YeeE/YedE thiosulfate transporter family protein [Desulfuromonadaceae bacterium]|nr:YeeE/YedE thiosulfate transporter family protein [Desulfuromonadaceae bacterium]